MRRMVELKRAGKNIDLVHLTTLPDLESFVRMSYLSELLSFADVEKFDGMEKLILNLWREREKRNNLSVAARYVNAFFEGGLTPIIQSKSLSINLSANHTN